MNEKRPITFSLFFLRLVSGILGGSAGTLAAFVIYFIMLSFVPTGDENTSISVFVIILMAFVGTLVANIVTTLLVSFMDSLKYNRGKTMVTHVFIFNMILFVLSVPLYVIGASVGILMPIVALHFLLSAFVTALVMEVIAGGTYALLGVYSATVAIFITIVMAFVFITVSDSELLITLAAMPMVWFMLQLIGGLAELLYDTFVTLYGVDFLSTETDYGDKQEDSEKEMEQEEKEEEDEGGEHME